MIRTDTHITFNRVSEYKEMFNEARKILIPEIHNTYRTFHNKHIPYDVINKEWRKAEIKVARKNFVMSAFGMGEEEVYLFDIAKEITDTVAKRLDKKYKIKTA